MTALVLTLPWPPSLNHYWRHLPSRTLISEAGREYRSTVGALCRKALQGAPPLRGSLSVAMDAFPPDRRTRDLDNLLKGLLDALAHGGVYGDDGQIDRLEIVRARIEPPGRVEVRIVMPGHP
jgi:crossover junction endodeoxyribonuclease RusA